MRNLLLAFTAKANVKRRGRGLTYALKKLCPKNTRLLKPCDATGDFLRQTRLAKGAASSNVEEEELVTLQFSFILHWVPPFLHRVGFRLNQRSIINTFVFFK